MSATLWPVLHDLTERAAQRWDFSMPALVPAVPRRRATYFGQAEKRRGKPLLTIRMHVQGRPTRQRCTSAILGTLAHELAHFAEWYAVPDHAPEWRSRALEIANWIRSHGHQVSHEYVLCGQLEKPRHRRKRKRKKA